MSRVTAMQHQHRELAETVARMYRMIQPAIDAVEHRNDGWPSGSGAGNSISDPVGAQVARISDLLELDSQLKIAWITLTESSLTVTNLLSAIGRAGTGSRGATSHEDTKAEACTGGAGDWQRPCDRNAVRVYRIHGAEHALCDACRQRGQHHDTLVTA